MALTHLDFSPPARQLRQFAALWLPAFCALVALILLSRGAGWQLAAGIALGGLLVGGIACFVPPLSRCLWVVAMVAAFPIGFLVSHLVIWFIYYLILTPIGLILKFVGYDPLERTLDRDAETFWQEREPAPDASRYFRQY